MLCLFSYPFIFMNCFIILNIKNQVVGYSGAVKWMESDRVKYVVYAVNDVVILHDAATGDQQILCGANGRITAFNVCFPLPHVTPHRTPPPSFVAVAQENPHLIHILSLSLPLSSVDGPSTEYLRQFCIFSREKNFEIAVSTPCFLPFLHYVATGE
jgi:hypothetical protein